DSHHRLPTVRFAGPATEYPDPRPRNGRSCGSAPGPPPLRYGAQGHHADSEARNWPTPTPATDEPGHQSSHDAGSDHEEDGATDCGHRQPAHNPTLRARVQAG